MAALVTSPGCDDAVTDAVTDARLTDSPVVALLCNFCAGASLIKTQAQERWKICVSFFGGRDSGLADLQRRVDARTRAQKNIASVQ